MPKSRIKTYDRIVQESLLLFNEHGERNITTNHIAAHLGISPGNLYYHFRNKEEVIYQIFLQYRLFITERLSIPSGRQLDAQDLVNYLDTAFEAMWQFRFMFYDLPGLMARNPQLQQDYFEFVTKELQTILVGHFKEFIRLGLLKMQVDDIAPLSVNIWLIVKFWFAFEQTARPHEPITIDSSNRGVSQVLALLKPYVSDAFVPVFEQMLNRYNNTKSTTTHTPAASQ